MATTRLPAFLDVLGYGANLIERDYRVWIDVGREVTVDLALFGDPAVKDLSTSTAVCGVVNGASVDQTVGRLVEAARALAAPAVVVAQDSRVSWFATDATEQAWVTFGAEDTREVERLRPVLGPTALLAAKRGSPRQLSLFPVDAAMLARRRADASDSLAARVTEVFQAVALAVGGTSKATYQQAAQIVVRALAVAVLRDKHLVDPAAAVDIALQRWSQYFTLPQGLTARWGDLLDWARAELQDGIDYASVDSATLSEVYQRALAAGDSAKELGIVYTPPDMARAVLDTLPIEAIPPDRRLVFDPACGSGNLLVAAHDRLASLQSPQLALEESHSDLMQRIVGWDKDEFATEIARLSLLLHSLPLGNGWRIGRRDALSASGPTPAPSVIVMNPPWSWGDQREVADAFIQRALEWLAPGGLLAAILPGSFLSHRARRARKDLEDRCDVFEIWHLPERTFPYTRGTPSVVFARKTENKAGVRIVRRVLPRQQRSEEQTALRRLYRFHRADVIALDYGDVHVGGSSEVKPLSSLADVVNGPQFDPDAEPKHGRLVRFYGQNRHVKPLTEIMGNGDPVRFPDQFRRGRQLAWLPAAQKIVTRAYSYPNNGWRLVAGVAAPGMVTGHSTHVIRPHNVDDFDALLAYLNSAPASVWMDQRSPGRNLTLESLRELPVPIAPRTWAQLRSLGAKLRSVSHVERSPLLSKVDAVALEGLDDPALVAAVRLRLAGVPDPLGHIRIARSPVQPDATQHAIEAFWRSGATVRADPPSLVLALPGVTPLGGARMPPPSALPGWLAREGASFEFAGDPSDVNSLVFRFQDAEWLDWPLSNGGS